MSEKPRKPENGTDFERDLEAVQARWDRMEHAEPPGLVDQAVLNRARRDLEAGRKRRPLRWLGGFATATVVVLALAIVLEQEPQGTTPAIERTEKMLIEEPAAAVRTKDSKSTAQPETLPPAEPEPMKREARRERQDSRSVRAAEGAREAEALADAPADTEGPIAEFMTAAPAAAEEADTAPPPPEAWIEQLLALKKDGRQAELEAGIEAFRQAHPDYPLPAELADDAP